MTFGAFRAMALRRIALLIVLAACVAGFTENESEVGRQSSQKAEDELWSCLQAQVQEKANSLMSPQDFAFYGKVACPQHAQAFLVKLVDYLKMKFPTVELHTHVAQAKRTIEQYRDAAEKVYLEMKPAKVP